MFREGEMESWISHSKKVNHPLFSELDVHLRAISRFFNVEYLTFSDKDLTSRNFYNELVAARDTILRILAVMEVVIPESRRNVYWFQKFAETKLLPEHKREIFQQDLYSEDTQEKSLLLLYDSFLDLKGVITDLIRSRHVSYQGFTNIGHLIGKEIRENVFFNPFRKTTKPEYNVINNIEISGIVKSIEDKKLKKQISIIYLYLFRFLRFMNFIDIETERSVSLNSSLAILILLRSEINMFLGYIEKVVKKVRPPGLASALNSIVYQFSMESKRVYLQELRDIHQKKAPVHFRGKLENCHGILKNLTEQSIFQLSLQFRPELKGDQIFESFVTRLEQSLRLREDIFILHKFTSLLGSRTADADERLKVFESLRNYMLYFESFTFRLLRHDDYEEFVKFFNELNSINKNALLGPEFRKIIEKIDYFRIYLEATLRHISNRSELDGRSVDMERVESFIRQYL